MSKTDPKIPIALNHMTKLDLSCNHLTTMPFMHVQPVFYRHVIKGEHLNFKCLASVLPSPIEVPLFGEMRLNLRGFFVPYRLCMPNWDEFYNDTIASNVSGSSLVTGVPVIAMNTLQDMFLNSNYGLTVLNSTLNPAPDPDFEYVGNSYNYTTRGRIYLKTLESLGYKISWGRNGKEFYYNALGILALAKLYVDWYSNSQYQNSSSILSIQQALKFNDPGSQLVMSAAQLFNIIGLATIVVYDSDGYFIDAWDNPAAPSLGTFTQFTFADPTSSNGAFVQTNTQGTPEMLQYNANLPNIGTEYIHQALRKLSDFQRRHALAGARSIDRILAQYGFVSDAVKQQRSIYVGSQSINVDTGVQYSSGNGVNGAGESSSVGDYSGKGFGRGEKDWDFRPDEEGIFLVMASLLPAAEYVQGYDRNNRHLDKKDFFVPEFDALSVQAIEKGELYVSPSESFIGNMVDYAGVFGFTGRYGEYKRSKSFVTGDVSLPSINAGGNAWHLARLLSDTSFGGGIANMVHSLEFTRGEDYGQYNRIFQYVGVDRDPFYVHFHFDVGVHAPCKPLMETYEFEDNAKQIQAQSNGSKLN